MTKNFAKEIRPRMNKTKAGNTAVRLEAAKDLVHYLERDHRYSLNDSELETVVNLLLELSTDKNSAIRIQGIGGIKYYTSHHSGQMEGNLPLLENSITRFIEGSKDDEIRKKVMGGLMDITDCLENVGLELRKNLTTRLLELTRYEDVYPRRIATHCLGEMRMWDKIPDEQRGTVVTRLLELTNDPGYNQDQWTVRVVAVDALGYPRILPELRADIVEKLLELVGDRDKNMRRNVALALDRLGVVIPTEFGSKVMAALVVLQNDHVKRIRECATSSRKSLTTLFPLRTLGLKRIVISNVIWTLKWDSGRLSGTWRLKWQICRPSSAKWSLQVSLTPWKKIIPRWQPVLSRHCPN